LAESFKAAGRATRGVDDMGTDASIISALIVGI